MLYLRLITTEVDALDMLVYLGQDVSQGTAFNVYDGARVASAFVDEPSDYQSMFDAPGLGFLRLARFAQVVGEGTPGLK